MSAIYGTDGDAAGKRPQGRLHVLVVEDHDDTADLIKQSLEREGFAVRTAASHKAALEAACTWLPDVLVCDVGLGGKDGLEVMRTMREAHPGLKGIVVSGRCCDEDEARSLEAGFAEHLCKPIDAPQLAAAIQRALAT